ncbi:hypothetical protein [Persicirhabdus sediminis]|uniref:Uncharacterized protein n=1 Tax=Persicirhabdus sediminis TaxID=454144 RepID=A0A8J7MFL8_9BACT|nr:hypothetical protein [Persicirhabdus sediminis]MBK1792561.1 hypothetical protein [Persicirhabdus sediminis]
MRIISIKDAVYAKIEETLGENQDATELENIAGIDCDEDDIALQRELGSEDPAVAIELIVQWHEEFQEGILDWFYLPESQADSDKPDIMHGGALLAFNYKDSKLDFDKLIEEAIPALNEACEWAEFELDEDGE